MTGTAAALSVQLVLLSQETADLERDKECARPDPTGEHPVLTEGVAVELHFGGVARGHPDVRRLAPLQVHVASAG